MSFYLYGILPLPGPSHLDLKGLDDQPVMSCELGGFVFIYGPATRERYRTSRANLITHEQVLEHLMELGFRCLLPLQFGLVVQDWEQVELDLVTGYGPQLTELFGRLVGKREVGVKVYWDPVEELKILGQEDQRVIRQREALQGKTLTMDQTIAVGRLIEVALSERQEAIIQHFDRLLYPLAHETRDNSLLSKEMIYNKAFLIPWDDEPLFDAQVEILGTVYGDRLRIRYTQFTAPYNFAMLA